MFYPFLMFIIGFFFGYLFNFLFFKKPMRNKNTTGLIHKNNTSNQESTTQRKSVKLSFSSADRIENKKPHVEDSEIIFQPFHDSTQLTAPQLHNEIASNTNSQEKSDDYESHMMPSVNEDMIREKERKNEKKIASIKSPLPNEIQLPDAFFNITKND